MKHIIRACLVMFLGFTHINASGGMTLFFSVEVDGVSKKTCPHQEKVYALDLFDTVRAMRDLNHIMGTTLVSQRMISSLECVQSIRLSPTQRCEHGNPIKQLTPELETAFWETMAKAHPDLSASKDLRSLPISSLSLVKNVVLKVSCCSRPQASDKK